MKMRILPSLLAADVGNLEASARAAEGAGADALHLDIMDGVFVPNISMGPAVVAMARRCIAIPLNVHLMLIRPERYITPFREAGADTILIHIEAECDVPAVLREIARQGARRGITLNPDTPASRVTGVLDMVEEVLCMSVHPGYGGQAFMPNVLPKIRELRDGLRARGRPDVDIMVDGGIDLETAPQCAAHGANAFVAGTALYHADDMAASVRQMRDHAQAAFR